MNKKGFVWGEFIGFVLVIGVFIFLIGGLIVGGLRDSRETEERKAAILETLDGTHQLRKMQNMTSQEGSFSGSYFLFAGGISGSTETKPKVSFAWQLSDGSYAISTLPLEKFRIKFVEDAHEPTISFQPYDLRFNIGCEATLPQKLDQYVAYALLECQEDQWNINIEMPMK